MSRRPFVLLALSLATAALAACSDTTAPTGPTSQRQVKPTAANADVCVGGYMDSTGKAC